jgi:hypothetical protein
VEVLTNPNATGALEQQVELGRGSVSMPRRRLTWARAPQPRPERTGLKLLGKIGVQHTHLV